MAKSKIYKLNILFIYYIVYWLLNNIYNSIIKGLKILAILGNKYLFLKKLYHFII